MTVKRMHRVIQGDKKWCGRCQLWLPFDSFSVSRATSHGLCSWCRVCKLAAKNERIQRLRDLPDPTLAERFAVKVRKGPNPDDCHEWLGNKTRDGYGHICAHGRMHCAHRVIFELEGRTIPDGYYVDHICRNRGCVNIRHLNPVTKIVSALKNNTSPFAQNAAKTHCIHGHEFTAENTVRIRIKTRFGHDSSTRVCLTCAPHMANSGKRIDQEAA